jgi:O-antigen/teichoic acid export membrane protein
MKTKLPRPPAGALATRDGNGRNGLWGSVLDLLRRRTSRHAGILTVSQYVTMALGLVTVTAATRLLGSSGYGGATLIMAFPSFVRSLLEFKSVSVTTRYIANFQGAGRDSEIGGIVKAGYGLDLIVALLSIVVVGLLGPYMATQVFNMTNLGWLAVAYAMFFPFASLKKTSTAILTVFQEFTWIAIFNILDRLLALTLIVSVLLAGYKVHGYVLANGIVIAATGVAMTFVSVRLLNRRVPGWSGVPLASLRPIAREMAAFFGWNNLITTLGAAAGQAPVLVLGALAGKEAAGFFNLAKTIMTVSSYPEDALTTVTFPAVAKRWGAGERDSLWAQLKRWTATGGLAIAGIPLVAAAVAPFIVPAVFGDSFGGAVRGIQLLLVGSVAGSIFFWLKPIYYAAGDTRQWAFGYVVRAVLILGLGWIASMRAGFVGMAAVSAIVDSAFVLLMTAWAYTRLNKSSVNRES